MSLEKSLCSFLSSGQLSVAHSAKNEQNKHTCIVLVWDGQVGKEIGVLYIHWQGSMDMIRKRLCKFSQNSRNWPRTHLCTCTCALVLSWNLLLLLDPEIAAYPGSYLWLFTVREKDKTSVRFQEQKTENSDNWQIDRRRNRKGRQRK